MEFKKYKKYSRPFPDTDGDDIVISGMSGKFPNCRNISEYKYKLYNKVSTNCALYSGRTYIAVP